MRKHYALTFWAFLVLSTAAVHAQNVTVNPGAASYPTLKAAFDAINAGTHQGTVYVDIVGNTTETATATLNANGDGAASYDLIIITAANNVTVSGNLAAPLIDLNGADNVTIDGSAGGTGANLTISNTSTSTAANTSTIRFINDASNNTITNCFILGSCGTAANPTTAAGNILFSTGSYGGNDSNMIVGNYIGAAGNNLPSRGIASFGSPGKTNSDNIVANNNIYDIFNATYSAAMDFNDYNDHWTITGTHIYQTATRTGTGTGINYGIRVDGAAGAESFTIAANAIGWASPTQTGVYTINGTGTSFQGIAYTCKSSTSTGYINNNFIAAVNVGNTSAVNYGININVAAGGAPLNLDGNVVTNITSSGNLYAIAITGAGAGKSALLSNNTVSVISLTGAARFYGILHNPGDGGDLATITGNTVTNISLNGSASGAATGSPALACIYVASGPASVINNTVGSQTSTNSVSCVQTSGSTSSFDVLGIFVKGIDSLSVTNNLIGGLYADNTAATSGTARIFGIRTGSTGVVTCRTNTIGGTAANSIHNNSTFAGTSILGIYNNAGTTTFDSNTVRNITSGGGTGTGANSSVAGIVNAANSVTNITNSLIHDLSSQGASVAGILLTNGTASIIAGNTIYNISDSGSGTTRVVSGIQVSGGTSANVYKNKIYGLSQMTEFTNVGGVNGLLLSGGTTVTAYNNIIGDLKGAGNSIDAIRGISITSTTANSTYRIYHNTVVLDATSGGLYFGTSALFHAASAIATTATLELKNNILVNISTYSGSPEAFPAAFRRWSGTGAAASLANYATTSNNNLFFVAPTSPYVVYSDSINADPTLADFQARVGPRETASVTENPPTISATGSDPNYLHIVPAIPTLVESGGMHTGIGDDYDGDFRQGHPSYVGTGTAPDIGADEFSGTVLPVTLVSFNGEQAGAANRLNWITQTEINNKGFELERSNDGRHYSTIAAIASKADNGYSTSPLYYSFTDVHPLPYSSYRLRQMDKDGRSNYSSIVVIKRNATTAIYPNPAGDVLHIALYAPADGKVSLVINNVDGKIVWKQNAHVVTGSNILSVNIAHLAAGTYGLTARYSNRPEAVEGTFIKQ